MQWEYHLFSTGLDREERSIEETLNSLGKEGWDLVAVYEAGFRVFVLKRREHNRRQDKLRRELSRQLRPGCVLVDILFLRVVYAHKRLDGFNYMLRISDQIMIDVCHR